jgi:hypothetical protein
MFRSNYVASVVDFKSLDDVNCTVQVDGKTYAWRGDNDPEYMDDGVMDISFWVLLDGDDNETDMVLAFYRRDDGRKDPQEWSDEYDVDHPKVILFT